MVDLVVPSDRMAVITAWERARTTGLAVIAVHTLVTRSRGHPDDPRRPGSSRCLARRVDRGRHRRAGTGRRSHGRCDAHPAPTEDRDDPQDMFASYRFDDARPGCSAGPRPDGRSPVARLHPSRRPGARRCELVGDALDQEGQPSAFGTCARTGAGSGSRSSTSTGADDPDDVVVTAELSDISDEMAAHEALHRREQLFHGLAESLPTGVSRSTDRSSSSQRAAGETLGVPGRHLDQ